MRRTIDIRTTTPSVPDQMINDVVAAKPALFQVNSDDWAKGSFRRNHINLVLQVLLTATRNGRPESELAIIRRRLERLTVRLIDTLCDDITERIEPADQRLITQACAALGRTEQELQMASMH